MRASIRARPEGAKPYGEARAGLPRGPLNSAAVHVLLAVSLLMAWPLVSTSARADAAVQDELVARGNVAYQEGRYSEAIDAYEAVLSSGFSSAGLQYNLGNAYFKAGDLGRAILHWERALALAPGDPDTRANLELARSLTVDAIEPLPTFWVISAVSWWVRLLPRNVLIAVVAGGWLVLSGGLVLRILAPGERLGRAGKWLAIAGASVVLLLGTNLFVREFGIGSADRAVILVDAVSVRSAPARDDDLVLFEIHEGTRVRIEERTAEWAEVVLDDGKVGWVPVGAFEEI